MCKIKLLISLLISLLLLSCSVKNDENKRFGMSLGYVGGGYEGLILSNILEGHLRSKSIYDKGSIYIIKPKIKHSKSLFITNIDNTSDRENVITSINLVIFNNDIGCNIFSFTDEISQFYIYSSGEKFISNTKALEKIKYNNTEELVKKFMNKIRHIDKNCEE